MQAEREPKVPTQKPDLDNANVGTDILRYLSAGYCPAFLGFIRKIMSYETKTHLGVPSASDKNPQMRSDSHSLSN